MLNLPTRLMAITRGRVVPLEAPPAQRKLGFLAGRGTVTADMKKTFTRDIDAMFGAAR